MNDSLKKLMQTLLPFLIFGVAVATLIGFFILFSYVLVWGLIIGAVLWLGYSVKNYLFPPRSISKPSGRVIDQDKKN